MWNFRDCKVYGLKKYRKVTDFKVLRGRGVEGKIGSKEIIIGNVTLMNEKKIKLSEAHPNYARTRYWSHADFLKITYICSTVLESGYSSKIVCKDMICEKQKHCVLISSLTLFHKIVNDS